MLRQAEIVFAVRERRLGATSTTRAGARRADVATNGRPRTNIRVTGRSCSTQYDPIVSALHPSTRQGETIIDSLRAPGSAWRSFPWPGDGQTSTLAPMLRAAMAGSRIGRDWADRRQQMVPLPFPELEVAEGVFAPTQGSYLLWKTLFLRAYGHNLHCLDVGSGCGVLAVQMALNGAASVDALDIQEAAVANTLENAALNGVRAAVSAEVADLNHWRPRRRYDLVVASLYQMPVDPKGEPQPERPPDFWGRDLLDLFLRLLPQLLVDGGRALVLQLSIVGQQQTAALLEELGLEGRIVDFGFFPFGPLFTRNAEQISVVESLSDAHHIHVGDEDVMIAYALEIRRKAPDWSSE